MPLAGSTRSEEHPGYSDNIRRGRPPCLPCLEYPKRSGCFGQGRHGDLPLRILLWSTGRAVLSGSLFTAERTENPSLISALSAPLRFKTLLSLANLALLASWRFRLYFPCLTGLMGRAPPVPNVPLSRLKSNTFTIPSL